MKHTCPEPGCGEECFTGSRYTKCSKCGGMKGSD
jgi:hypothetical protein